MDDRRSLNDASLECDLSRALRVDHAPEFLARVRIRIASDAKVPSNDFRRFAVPAVTLGIAAVALIVAGVAIWRPELTEPLPARHLDPAVALEAPAVVPETMSASAGLELPSGPAQADVRTAPAPQPRPASDDIVVARDEIEAIVVLARHVHEGRVVLLMPDSPMSGDFAVGAADIAPITIDPLPRLTPLQENRP